VPYRKPTDLDTTRKEKALQARPVQGNGVFFVGGRGLMWGGGREAAEHPGRGESHKPSRATIQFS